MPRPNLDEEFVERLDGHLAEHFDLTESTLSDMSFEAKVGLLMDRVESYESQAPA